MEKVGSPLRTIVEEIARYCEEIMFVSEFSTHCEHRQNLKAK